MIRPGRVLVLDDHKAWRDLLSDTLSEGGFLVDCVDSKAAALQRMNDSFYHLLIVDVNLDDTDEDNKDGLELLVDIKEGGISSGLKVMILTAYGTMDLMREAFIRYKVVDFVEKDKFLYDEFLEQVKLLFQTELDINLDLEIVWDRLSGPKDVVANLLIGDSRVKPGTDLADLAARELEDLLCRLFHRATQVLVSPLTPGHSGASVLWAQPVYRSVARSVVVKFGDRKNVDREYANFRDYVAPYIGGGRSTSIPNEGLRRTTRLGGIVYDFLGADTDKLYSFGSYYKRTASAFDIAEVVHRLFKGTCSRWYGNKSQSIILNLTRNYQELLGFAPERLANYLEDLRKYVQAGAKLKFEALGDRSFTNPLHDLPRRIFNRPAYVSVTHGDFNETNILVDRDGYSWLIDFGRTGEGHILRDVAELDSVVRFRLLEEGTTLEDRVKLEEGLMRVPNFKKLQSAEFDFNQNSEERLEQYLKTGNPDVHKAFLVALALRRMATDYVPPPNEDMNEYYVALLYNAVNTLRFVKSIPSIQRLHALVSASLLTDQLAQKASPFEQVGSLYS